jgi:hypothetical protein
MATGALVGMDVAAATADAGAVAAPEWSSPSAHPM